MNNFVFSLLVTVTVSVLLLNFDFAQAQNKSKKKKTVSPKEELIRTANKEERQAELEEVAAFAKMGKQVIPQFYWQADAGQFLASPFIEAAYFKTEGTLVTGTPGGVQYDISGQGYRAGVDVEFGVIDKLALGGRLVYQVMLTNEDVSTESGIEDIVVYAKGHYGFLRGSLHYGMRIGFSPGLKTEDGQGNANAFSGGYSVTPYLGFSKRFATGYAGIDLSYEYKGDRETDRNYSGTIQTVRSTLVGGHIFRGNLFYEKVAQTWSFGTFVGFSSESSKEFRDPNKTKPTPEDGESNFIIGAYAPFLVGSTAITPRLEYRTFLDDQLGSRLIDIKWTAVARVDFRFAF